VVREYRRATFLGVLLTVLLWTLAAAVVGGLLVAAWPLVIAAFCGSAVAGWPARRLVAGAVWCVPMLAAFAVAYWAGGAKLRCRRLGPGSTPGMHCWPGSGRRRWWLSRRPRSRRAADRGRVR
jgi:hypothetical protein